MIIDKLSFWLTQIWMEMKVLTKLSKVSEYIQLQEYPKLFLANDIRAQLISSYVN